MNLLLEHITRFSTIEWILSAVLIFFFIIQLFFILIVYRRPYRYAKKRNKNANNIDIKNLPGISVVIASKDNAVELSKNLPFILKQDYPEFEVIVVNSGSTDDTDVVLNAAEQKYPHFYHTFIPEGADEANEKKLALTLGIKAAKFDVVLFTESYCKPSSKNWIMEFAKEFVEGKDIVLGYCKLEFSKMARRRCFIKYDNLVHHLKFISMTIAGKPFMGIGRNMAYKKELFFNNKGFSSILGVDGGEDDLYINKIAKKKNTGVVISSDSMTETDSVDSFYTWRSLKSKYLYTKQFYNYSGPFGFDTFSKYLFYLSFLVVLLFSINTENWILFGFSLLLFIIRFFAKLSVINKNSAHFGAGKFHINLIFLELFQPISNLRFKSFAKKRYTYR